MKSRNPVAPLGELERAVMAHLWETGSGDVKAVHDAIGRRRRITLNTVQSTMERLFRKELLTREKVSHAYVYAPSSSRAELGARIIRELVREMCGGSMEPVLAAFVDLAARSGEAELVELERLVAERRSRHTKK